MKKLIIVSACLFAAVGALAQGTVNFANTSTTGLITYNGANAAVGSLTVGLYYGVAGTTDPATLTLIKTTGIAAPGRYLGGTATATSSAGGSAAVFEVRAWAGASVSYEAAVAAGADSGRSGLFNVAVLGNPTGTPPTPAATLGAPAFTVAVVPEPSTIALGLLGLGALLIRRRK
jgi:hypothetical protein